MRFLSCSPALSKKVMWRTNTVAGFDGDVNRAYIVVSYTVRTTVRRPIRQQHYYGTVPRIHLCSTEYMFLRNAVTKKMNICIVFRKKTKIGQ
jgi:hypothetical protein